MEERDFQKVVAVLQKEQTEAEEVFEETDCCDSMRRAEGLQLAIDILEVWYYGDDICD